MSVNLNLTAEDAKERVLEILRDPVPGDILSRQLKADGLPELPFLADAPNIPAGPLPYHSGSVLKHLSRCMNAVSGDELAVWMALCHDAGKLTTPKTMWPHHYGHDERGVTLARLWAKNLGLGRDFEEAGALASKEHMRGTRYPIMKPGKSLKLLKTIFNSGYAPQLLRVMDADSHSSLSQLLLRHWQAINALPADEDRRLRELTRLKAQYKRLYKK